MQLADACGVTHFFQSLGFNLTDALASHAESFSNFFKRASKAIAGGGCFAEGIPAVDEPAIEEVVEEVAATEAEVATAN